MATDGWEMFQPPLYYFSAAMIYNLFGGEGSEPSSLKAVQVYTTLTGLANIWLTWWLLCVLFPRNSRQRNLGFSVAAMLPMGFYMNSMISNEIFSGGMIGLAIFLAVRFGFGRMLSWRDALLIGSGCGLGLLSKYTGLFVFLSVVFLLFLRQVSHQQTGYRDDRKSLTALTFSFRLPPVLLIAVTLTLSGWLYARNLINFGDPFIGNWDKVSGFHYEQLPGYRTLGFYTRFGSVFFALRDNQSSEVSGMENTLPCGPMSIVPSSNGETWNRWPWNP